MIADRQPFVVRQERIVGAEQLADSGRMMDAGIEVGVVADRRWQVHRAVGRTVQQALHSGPFGRAHRQQLEELQAKRPAWLRPQTQQPVQLWAGGSGHRSSSLTREEPGCRGGGEVEDLLADRNTGARAAA